jgi:membrane-associated phospholipid phosphatase
LITSVSIADAQSIVGLDAFATADYAPPVAPAPGVGLGDASRSRTGGVMLDDAVRNAFRLGSADARATADLTSDILLYSLIASPFIENIYAVADGDRSWGDYWQHLTVDFAALGLTYGLIELIKSTVERDRPYVSECLRSGPAGQCYTESDAQESFLSGHTAMAFTGAGLVCAHAASGEDDTVTNTACAASMALAALTGGLRIMADAHYASDVLAGAALGLVMGYFLPRLALEF